MAIFIKNQSGFDTQQSFSIKTSTVLAYNGYFHVKPVQFLPTMDISAPPPRAIASRGKLKVLPYSYAAKNTEEKC